MPVNLTEPAPSIVIDKARIANIVIEHNPFLGQYWLLVYVVLGRLVDGVWEQRTDPEDGATALFFRIQPGINPHAQKAYPGQPAPGAGAALGKCDTCGAWHHQAAGDCTEDGCAGTIQPYDGFERLCLAAPAGSTCYEVIKTAVYSFLTTEEAPDPAGVVRPLLAASMG